MRNAASCCQLLQEIWLPRGALSGVYPAGVSVSVGITADGNGCQWSVASGLPGRVGGAVAGGLVRGAVDIADTGCGLVGTEERIVLHRHPVWLAGDGILGNSPEIAGRDEFIQRLRGLGLVHGVVVDAGAQREKILFEHAL